MSRLVAFLMYLAVALSLGFGPVAHAAEGATAIEISAADAAISHVDGDGDQVPADAEKGYPHHHGGCDGHHIGVPIKLISVQQIYIAPLLPHPFDHDRVARAPADPGLRPPIA